MPRVGSGMVNQNAEIRIFDQKIKTRWLSSVIKKFLGFRRIYKICRPYKNSNLCPKQKVFPTRDQQCIWSIVLMETSGLIKRKTASHCVLFYGIGLSSAGPVTTEPEFGHHCACRCPNARCWAISMHHIDHNLDKFSLTFNAFVQHSVDHMASFKMSFLDELLGNLLTFRLLLVVNHGH